MSDIEGFLSSFLRGENPAWPTGQENFATSLLEHAEYHGVLALLHDRLQAEPEARREWPATVIDACRESALAHAMWELRHRALLKEVFSKLVAAGVTPVVFKGTALAYTLYSQGALRSRCDTDLIIPPGMQTVVANTLTRLGFEQGVGISGESVAYEASFTRFEPGGGPHTLDVHWRISNFELLSRLFTHDELLKQSIVMTAIGPDARAAGPVHALLIACMHRAAHKRYMHYLEGVAHSTGNRLIWIYDLHLLATTFSTTQWDEFVRIAEQKGFCGVCLEGLERAQTCFHTEIPAQVLAKLVHPGSSEKITCYFASSTLRQGWMDFLAIEGLSSKLRFLSENLLPSASYMHEKYPDGGWLPWLYLRRASGGVLKRLKRDLDPS